MIVLYWLLVLLIALQRGLELVLSGSNEARLRRLGAYEVGGAHYFFMRLLHLGWLLACLLESPHRQAGLYVCLIGWWFLLGGQALRWWTIVTLGRRWCTKVLVLPGEKVVTDGPFRHLRHPNYLGVCLELVGLPLIRGCWMTALIFTVLNGLLLAHRISVEEKALMEDSDYLDAFSR